jgi:trehalose/maltose hydrolase-like predicted phosphorylase
MQQFFRWTGDKVWLAEMGYPIAEGVAEWIMSRVTLGGDGLYHINKIMPVGEYVLWTLSHQQDHACR